MEDIKIEINLKADLETFLREKMGKENLQKLQINVSEEVCLFDCKNIPNPVVLLEQLNII